MLSRNLEMQTCEHLDIQISASPPSPPGFRSPLGFKNHGTLRSAFESPDASAFRSLSTNVLSIDGINDSATMQKRAILTPGEEIREDYNSTNNFHAKTIRKRIQTGNSLQVGAHDSMSSFAPLLQRPISSGNLANHHEHQKKSFDQNLSIAQLESSGALQSSRFIAGTENPMSSDNLTSNNQNISSQYNQRDSPASRLRHIAAASPDIMGLVSDLVYQQNKANNGLDTDDYRDNEGEYDNSDTNVQHFQQYAIAANHVPASKLQRQLFSVHETSDSTIGADMRIISQEEERSETRFLNEYLHASATDVGSNSTLHSRNVSDAGSSMGIISINGMRGADSRGFLPSFSPSSDTGDNDYTQYVSQKRAQRKMASDASSEDGFEKSYGSDNSGSTSNWGQAQSFRLNKNSLLGDQPISGVSAGTGGPTAEIVIKPPNQRYTSSYAHTQYENLPETLLTSHPNSKYGSVSAFSSTSVRFPNKQDWSERAQFDPQLGAETLRVPIAKRNMPATGSIGFSGPVPIPINNVRTGGIAPPAVPSRSELNGSAAAWDWKGKKLVNNNDATAANQIAIASGLKVTSITTEQDMRLNSTFIESKQGKNGISNTSKSNNKEKNSKASTQNVAVIQSKQQIESTISEASNTTLRDSRDELVESPNSKNSSKQFYRVLRLKERENVSEAVRFAESALMEVPENVRWRVYLELADLAKRQNDFQRAREYYKCACEKKPQAPQSWTEWSKMEEECGNLRESLQILRLGLKQCSFNEGLLTKAVRQQERLHKLQDARSMLAMLKHENIEKTWKAVLEGALLEERAGRLPIARLLFKFLIQNVPWYGPIYYEAFKLEEKNGNLKSAAAIARRGLAELPRYGPLWFGLLKIEEKADAEAEKSSAFTGRSPKLPRMRTEVDAAVRDISRELVWKIHFEHAQALERAAEVAAAGLLVNSTHYENMSQARDALLASARQALIRSALACPANLRWKIWLAGARLEVGAGHAYRARRLLCQALAEAPAKHRSTVYLECSRLEEFYGRVDVARRLLIHVLDEAKSEWKPFLELIMLEARAGRIKYAAELTQHALEMHPGTGRIWAVFVQLCHRLEGTSLGVNTDKDATPLDSSFMTIKSGNNIPSKHEALLRALREVPKSGEVWAEGARCRLNPLHVDSFDLGGAQKFLGFAAHFTPQYGDSFVEMLRVEMLTQVVLPYVLVMTGQPVATFLSRFVCLESESDSAASIGDASFISALVERIIRSSTDFSAAASSVGTDVNANMDIPPRRPDVRRKVLSDMLNLRFDIQLNESSFSEVVLERLLRRCTNAEPNYGVLWYFCRAAQTDSPADVLRAARAPILQELLLTMPLYVRACCYYVRHCYANALGGADSVGCTTEHVMLGPSGRLWGQTSRDEHTSLDAAQVPSITAEVKPHIEYQLAKEYLSDFRAVHDFLTADLYTRANSAPENDSTIQDCNVPLVVNLGHGRVFSSPDFISASIGLNRLTLSRTAPAEARRKVLYEPDQLSA